MTIKAKVFEPAMCCSSGLCGPSVDEDVVAFNQTIERIKSEGHEIERFMITQDSAEFQKEDAITAILKEEQLEALPITMVNGRVIKKGAYPTYEEILARAG